MRNVVLARIDDRLIHGEVITGWLPVIKATRIYIVDDAAAGDGFTKRVLQASAPRDLHCFVYPVDAAAEKLKAKGKAEERLMILVKTPLTLARLMEKGVPFGEVNLGGVGPEEGRRPFFKNVFLNREEVTACEKMLEAGCDLYFQLVPDQRRYEIRDAVRRAKDLFED